ncbi:MAG: hypothetical protein CM15mP74_35850 [Halieaceae bacterium]|nr:MAG: hypothetical protein CM15mP74_35850 [Halieaceae bacterium]
MAARPADAVEAYQRAVELDPELPGAHIGLGHVLKTVGDQAKGIAAYRRAIELSPISERLTIALANLKTFRFTPSDIDEMNQRVGDTSLPVDCRVHFAFALGKAYED